MINGGFLRYQGVHEIDTTSNVRIKRNYTCKEMFVSSVPLDTTKSIKTNEIIECLTVVFVN